LEEVETAALSSHVCREEEDAALYSIFEDLLVLQE
jgi:hypothetical protein